MTSQGELAVPTRNQNLFLWKGPSVQINGKAHYQAFELNGVSFAIGDCVYLFPEDEHSSHYIGRLVSAYSDEQSPDPLCIEVKWYERRTTFEPNTRGIEESEREVFELEDTDINQIGCISGKVQVVRSRSYEEAYAQLQGADYDWYFCRGYFMQASNSFQYYTEAELGMFGNPLRHPSPAAAFEPKPEVNDMLDEDGTPTPDPINQRSGLGRTRKGGRVCLECGATQTPQWREGPHGPRTLCNSCGLRIVRAAARLNKRAGSSGSGRGGGGRGGGSRSGPGSSKKGQKSQAAAAELTPHEDAASALLSWPLEAPPKAAPLDDCRIDPTCLKEGPELGRGGFGVVLHGHLQLPGHRSLVKVAIKKLSLNNPTEMQRTEFTFEVIATVQASRRCPHVLHCYGYSALRDGSLCLVMKYYARGTLQDLIIRQVYDPLPMKQVLQLALDIALGVQELHAAQILIDDIKASNVLIDDDGGAVIADFGLSRPLVNKTHVSASVVAGTIAYMAPEKHEDTDRVKFGFAADIWALGITLAQIVAADVAAPWRSQSASFIIRKLAVEKQPPEVNATPELPGLQTLIQDCLRIEPRSRPSADMVVKRLQDMTTQYNGR